MSEQKTRQVSKNDKMKKRDSSCKMCGSRKGVISKYNLNICRRCFKDNAERIGFHKYD